MMYVKNKLSLTPLCVVILGLWLATSLSACSKSVSWEEEVKLKDGRQILITRTQYYESYSELGAPGDGWRPVKSSLKFKIEQASPYEIVWEESLGPLILEVQNNQPIVVAVPNSCEEFNKHGRPSPSYVIFRYTNNSWQRIRFAEIGRAHV